MASFSKLFIASGVLATVALAAPMNQARDIVTDTVWTTIDITTTVWDNGSQQTSAPVWTSALDMTPTVTMTSSTMAPSIASVAAPISSPSSSTVAPAPVTPTTTAMTTAAMTSAPASTSAAAVLNTSQTIARSASGVADAPMSASSSGTCEGTGNACVGDVTHWDGGLGACGTVVNTASDFAIALPFAFMGTLSNTNPYCGQSVTLLNPTTGTTVQAVVGDKCMGCVDRAIDCTDVLFDAITDNLGNGRMSGIEWWFT